LRHRPTIKNQLKAGLLEQGFCLSRTASASAVHNDFLIEFDTHLEQGTRQALERVIERALDSARSVFSFGAHIDYHG
jgi:hypothetical protein